MTAPHKTSAASSALLSSPRAPVDAGRPSQVQQPLYVAPVRRRRRRSQSRPLRFSPTSNLIWSPPRWALPRTKSTSPPMAPPSPPAEESREAGCGMAAMELNAALTLADLAGAAPAESCAASSALADDEAEGSAHKQQCPDMAVLIGGRRGRQGLAEAEKKEKRLRRVLANRESARRTIRRRQALRELLSKKVAHLTLEYDNLKMEKDLAVKEYLSLKNTNERLKEQIVRIERCEPPTCSTIPFIEQSNNLNGSGLKRVPPCARYLLLRHECMNVDDEFITRGTAKHDASAGSSKEASK